MFAANCQLLCLLLSRWTPSRHLVQYEAMGTLAVSGLLLLAGYGIAQHSYFSLLEVGQLWVEADTAGMSPPATLQHVSAAVGTAAASVVAKELLFHWTYAVGKRSHRPVRHHCLCEDVPLRCR